MKNLTTLQFCELATSKEEARFNLNAVYRDLDCLVSTDGNRLHYVNGQPKLDKGHFLNGMDAEFLEYKQVIPTKVANYTFLLTFADYEAIKLLIPIAKSLCKTNYPSILHFTPEGAFILIRNSYFDIKVKLTNPNEDKIDLKIGINLKYLEEALRGSVIGATLELWDERSVMRVARPLADAVAGIAYIMPCRL